MKTDFDGYPIAFDLTGGERVDAPHFPVLLDLGPDIDPRAAIGDKGYASRANREAARNRGAIAVIPRKANDAKSKPRLFPRRSTRAAPASNSRRQAQTVQAHRLRCEKTRQTSPPSSPSPGFILIKSVPMSASREYNARYICRSAILGSFSTGWLGCVKAPA